MHITISQLKVNLNFQLESWFKTGAAKKPQGQRPTSTLTARPTSESDIVDPDDDYLKMIETMSEKEINVKIEELLVTQTNYILLKKKYLTETFLE